MNLELSTLGLVASKRKRQEDEEQKLFAVSEQAHINQSFFSVFRDLWSDAVMLSDVRS